MASFSRSLFPRPEAEVGDPEAPVAGLDSLFGEVPDMDPVWAEGSEFFHTKDRCRRYQAIEEKNKRTQKTEPVGKMLCEICRQISLKGRKG